MSRNISRIVVAPLIFGTFLGCSGGSRCGIDGSGWPPPEITVTLTDAEGLLDNTALCEAEMSIVDINGVARFAAPELSGDSCRFSSGTNLGEQDLSETFDLSVHLASYKSVIATNISRVEDADNCRPSYYEVVLEPSLVACADGYYDHRGECKTRSGCPFPQYEEPMPPEPTSLEIPGAFPLYDFACTDECTLGVSAEAAICETVYPASL